MHDRLFVRGQERKREAEIEVALNALLILYLKVSQIGVFVKCSEN